METNVNVTVPENYDGKPVVVHLLTGAAPNVVNKESFRINGDITAPVTYLKGQQPSTIGTVVSFDAEKMEIVCDLNIELETHSSVRGTIEASNMVKEFGINQDKKFTLEALRKLVRLSGPWFANEDQHRALLINLNSFNAKIEATIADEKNNRGNENKALKRDVTTDVPFSFVLKGPVVKGGTHLCFNVDVCLEITDGGVRFWLESVELIKLTTATIEEKFADQYKAIEALGYTCIIKS